MELRRESQPEECILDKDNVYGHIPSLTFQGVSYLAISAPGPTAAVAVAYEGNKWTPHLSQPLSVAFTISIIRSTNGGECVVVQSLLFLQTGFQRFLLSFFAISESGVSFSLLFCVLQSTETKQFRGKQRPSLLLFFLSQICFHLSGYLSLSKHISGCYRV
ncbi:hypothetical protein V6N13_097728 [Hibiscus sabdariffa]